MPNCNGFVSVAGLLGVNVNVLGVAAVFTFAFAVFILPNIGIALAVVVVAAAVEPNVIIGVFVDVVFPNWKALVSGKINKNIFW